MNAARFTACLAILPWMIGCTNGNAGPVLDSFPDGHLDASAAPSGMSAPNMFALAIGPTGATQIGSGLGGTPPSCPTRTESGATTILEGGCTDDDGKTWYGRAVIPANVLPGTPTSGTITYEGFGWDEATDCATRADGRTRTVFDGTATFSQTASALQFDLDVVLTLSGVQDDCSESEHRIAMLYTGTMTQDGNARIWSGSGSMGNDLTGRLDAHTDDERIDDDVCSSEALSGSTTVTAGSDVAVITYDGATDCDPESTATWTLDGASQGEVSGVRCSASPGARGSAGLALFAIGAAMALRIRRRKR